MTFVSGIWAAILSPLVTTIGFIIWEHTWSQQKRSAFALNLYKCCFASILFLFTLWVISLVDEHESATNEFQPIRLVQEDEEFHARSRFVPSRSLWSVWSIDENHLDEDITRKRVIGYLTLSSTIGIIIGDILWLKALEILGTVRVVFMDALKPFCAALFGYMLLDEPLRWTILLGIVITMTGIILVSLEQRDSAAGVDGDRSHVVSFEDGKKVNCGASSEAVIIPNDNAESDSATPNAGIHIGHDELAPVVPRVERQLPTETHPPNPTAGSNLPLWLGYCMSIVNVVLDTYGSVLTKDYGISLSIWEINFIRFGFAGAVLLLMSIAMILYNWLLASGTTQTGEAPFIPSPPPTEANSSESSTNEAINIDALTPTVPDSGIKEPQGANNLMTSWYILPIFDDPSMTKWIWIYVSIGVVFVTYIAPTLSNYALFEISLALTLTLTSIGPLYALPLSFLVRHYVHNSISQGPLPRPPTLRAWIGAALSISGIILLAYTGD